MLQFRWATAARQLLTAAGISDATLARKMGKHRSAIARYLLVDTRHRPSARTMDLVNAAIAELICSQAGTYLQLVSERFFTDDETDDQIIVEDDDRYGFPEELRVLEFYFRDPQENALVVVKARSGRSVKMTASQCSWEDALNGLYERWTRGPAGYAGILGLNTSLLEARYVRLLQFIHGETPNVTEADEVLNICERHGFFVKQLLKPEGELKYVRARDEFLRTLRMSMARATSDLALRARLEDDILEALVSTMRLDADYNQLEHAAHYSRARLKVCSSPRLNTT